MSGHYLLGIDCGSSTAKSVIFTPDGRIEGVGQARVAQITTTPHHVERDMAATWEIVAGTVRAALADAGIEGSAIAGVGVTAHGDGLFLLDRSGQPLGHGIMSLDSRARQIHESWRDTGLLDRVMPCSGQRPYPYSATALLAWIRDHEPARYDAIGTAFFAKDWIRLCLTGEIATDLTEASTAFTDVHSQEYSREILDMLGLDGIAHALPDLLDSCAQAGGVSAEAARLTGLAVGTPVSAGLHDVTAAAVGLGQIRAGDMTVTAGTFSINEVLRDRPVTGRTWSCRAGYRRGLWNCMAISPASASNLEWMAGLTAPGDPDCAARLIDGAIARFSGARFSGERSRHVLPLYHPYLFGSPFEAPATASFLGLQSWHDPIDLFQAMIEGTIFNHRQHVEDLLQTGPVLRLGISGGGSRRPEIGQLFADILGRPVMTSPVREAGALGAALTAGVASGVHASLESAVAALDIEPRQFTPAPRMTCFHDRQYARYRAVAEALAPFWPGLIDASQVDTPQIDMPPVGVSPVVA
ncbi:FGGY-family carbohydrate kinase [Swaminathania salitolerans]|uniref:Carbohydrate kinase n=1 Tax=Swaminathania salitolerans TaxID=182838 RepID=A0A511BNL8_9PROT|nr:FGGY-family carbohydrate kinase [Swaminathania salitolerans]GBQ14912.1 carbohydrate kinase [Swaminathania salitolerans LMG 21291]GEL01929.1 carbohydrate kinase [Swaminathania salitolerans]